MNDRSSFSLYLRFLAFDFLLNLVFTFIDEPLYEPCVVFLILDMIFLLLDHCLCSKLFLFQIDNPVQLAILGCVTCSKLFIQRLFRLGHQRTETSVSVELSASQELIQSKEEVLGSFGTHIDDGFVLLLGNFELLFVQIYGITGDVHLVSCSQLLNFLSLAWQL